MLVPYTQRQKKKQDFTASDVVLRSMPWSVAQLRGLVNIAVHWMCCGACMKRYSVVGSSEGCSAWDIVL